LGLFEQNPLLLVPFVLVIVAGYDLAKLAVRALLRERQDLPSRTD
jgi:hypothetical protein